MKQLLIYTLICFCACACNTNAGAKTSGAAPASSEPSITTATSSTSFPDTPARDTLRLFFAGDMMPGTLYPQHYLPANDGRDLLKDVAPLLAKADFAAGNLEGVLTSDLSSPKKCGNPNLCYAFAIPPSYASLFKDAGFDALAITNNHANDFGPKGKESTRATLKKNGIPYAGASVEGDYVIIDKDGVKYALAAFSTSPGAPSINEISTAQSIIKRARQDADVVIVSFHGGAEGTGATRVTGSQELFHGEKRGNVKAFARACVDAGADVVFGHGPHVARGMELYKDKLIAYSLGNFCTPYRVNLSGICGYAPLLEVDIDSNGDFAGGRIHSMIQHKGVGPRTDNTHKAAAEIARLSKLDFPNSPLLIDSDGTLKKK